MRFVPLHVHTEYSLLDGAIRCKEYVKFAKKNGFNEFFETSAKLNINVNEIFDKMIDLLIEKSEEKSKRKKGFFSKYFG